MDLSEIRIVIEPEFELISAKWGEIEIGRLLYTIDNTKYKIEQVDVFNSDRTKPGFLRSIKLNLGLSKPGYRRNGIGRALMQTAINDARGKKLREVWGEVTASHLRESQFLLNFYRSLGFSIVPLDEDHLPDSIHKIQLTFY